MPPSKKRKGGGGEVDLKNENSAQVSTATSSSQINNATNEESELLKIDLWVDTVRRDIESLLEPAVLEIKREVQMLLNRLSTRVKTMRMQDFLKDTSGGDVQSIIAKDRRMQKLARTTARHTTTSAITGGVTKSRIGGASGGLATASSSSSSAIASGTLLSSSSSSSSTSSPLASSNLTPTGGGSKDDSRHQVSQPLASKTPSIALMKSAAQRVIGGAGGLPTRTPSHSTFLPKTPAPDVAKRARTKRRNEMVFHVAVSADGSPIVEAVPSSAAATTTMHVDVGADAALILDAGAADVMNLVAEGGKEQAELMLGALHALEEKIARMKGLIVSSSATTTTTTK
jgi:hypothetical protein